MTKDSALGPEQLTRATWRKSSHSGTSGTCVEIAHLNNGHHAIRNSNNPTGPALTVTPTQWAAFTTAVHAGEFD
ncbi:MAG: DUF397 domain-containing protein [Actinomycetota bacterium]|nr:DUF397 domain-containing protein [Actinomycetota bacterium]